MGTKPDWNYYRKIVNAMKKNGMRKQAEDVAKLIRVCSSVEKQDYPEAQHRLYQELPQRMIRADGSPS